jgi:hypothetical protein
VEKNRERWMELCEQAANERDRHKLMCLIAEIAKLLEEKVRRVRVVPPADPESSGESPSENGRPSVWEYSAEGANRAED